MTERLYFGTDGIRGKVGTSPITPEFMLHLGWAIGSVLGKGESGKILIGKDTRISGYLLESALEAGLTAAGLDTHLLGPLPTPAIAYLTRKERARAGIVISASHNPHSDNGIKLFCQNGFKLPDTVELEIEKKLEQPLTMADSAKLGKAYRMHDAVDQYVDFCLQCFPSLQDLSGLKIVLDCANGATYRAAPKAFARLNANLVNLGVNPNGLNINLNCGSTKPQGLQQAVTALNADLGIALDGDGDRLIMVDHTGEIVDGDEILYIIAQLQKQAEQLPGVVGTQMSNLGLEVALKRQNIPFARANVGDRYVLELLKSKAWLLGGESSGHIVDLNFTTTGDGLMSALQVLAALQNSDKTLKELKQGMEKFPQHTVNVTLPARMPTLLSSETIKAAVLDAEHALGEMGRILLRPSGTEPVIRVMAEGADAANVQTIAEQLASEVKAAIS